MVRVDGISKIFLVVGPSKAHYVCGVGLFLLVNGCKLSRDSWERIYSYLPSVEILALPVAYPLRAFCN